MSFSVWERDGSTESRQGEGSIKYLLESSPLIGRRLTERKYLCKSLAAIALIIALVAISACTSSSSGDSSNAPAEDESLEGLPSDFQRMAEVWRLLNREHIDGESLDGKTLSDGAIRGMLQALDDPYAAYLTAEQFSVESQDIQGFFEGIGAEVGVRDGRITIIAPMPDAPAEQAGIRPGDIILEIEGESTQGLSLMEAVTKIRGEKGTAIELLILHLDSSEPQLLRIVRGVIPLDSVRLTMQVGAIGHLRISTFTGTTNDEIKEALERFERSRGKGLILDLRNNPGGLLSSVVNVTSQFLDEGLVLYQVDAQDNRTDWQVKGGGKAKDIPMVVLVNNFSASASEVFAGAIMDHDRATVVGTATFGKGSVNNLFRLTDQSGINFTIARWFTPDGALIEGEGLTPDVIQEPSEVEGEDAQLDRALEILEELIGRSG